MPPAADTSSASAAFAAAASGMLKLTKKAELVQRLSDLHSALAGLSQEIRDRPKQLGAIAAQLISDKLLGSGDKEVRLLAVTCIVDVLRVYAPEAPYSEDELCSIFQAINRELRGLATCDVSSASGSRLLYVLRSLATVKSCVVVVFLAQNNIRGSIEVFNDLFEVLISSIRPEHSEEVALYVSTIMHECLEEAQEVRPEVLQLLLSALLPASRADNAAAYRVCQHVLKQSSAVVQGAVGDALNRILVGASSGLGDQLTSELDEHIYSLIYEVHKISTGLLLRILPNICVHLQSEELDIRLKAVKLLGRLFYSPHAEYGEEFSRNFKDYLGRFVDVSAEVRLEMVVSGGLIMKRKPHLRRMAEECMVKRLRDNEWEIRQAALSNLCDVAMESAAYLDEETYRELAERMKDRRPSIRRSAMALLAKVYGRHVSGSLPSMEDFLANDALIAKGTYGVSADTWRSLRIVPGYIIACWGYPEFTDRQLVIQLVQEYLLPKYSSVNIGRTARGWAGNGDMSPRARTMTTKESAAAESPEQLLGDADDIVGAAAGVGGASQGGAAAATRVETTESQRAMALLALFGALDPVGKAGLAGILGFKTKLRLALGEFLRNRSGDPSTGAKPASSMDIKRSCMKILSILVPQDKKNIASDALNSSKDNHVYRLFGRALVSPFTEAAANKREQSPARKASTGSRGAGLQPVNSPPDRTGFHANIVYRDDVRARFGSKTPLGEYAGCLYEMSAFMVANRNTVQHLLMGVASLITRSAATDSKKTKQDATITNAELSILNVLSVLAKYCPQSYEGAHDLVNDLLDSVVGVEAEAKTVETAAKSSKKSKSDSTVAPDATELLVIKNRDILSQLLTMIKGTAQYLWPLEVAQSDASEKPNQRRASQEPAPRGSVDNKLCRALLDYGARCSETEACYALAETARALLTVGGQAPEDNARWKNYIPSRVSNILTSYINPVLKSSAGDETIKRLPYMLFNLAALLRTGGQPAANAEKSIADLCVGAFVKSSISGVSDRDEVAPTILRGCIKAWSSCIDVVESARDVSPSNSAGKSSSGSEGNHKPESFHTEGSRINVLESTRRFLGLTLNCIESHGATFGSYQTKSSKEKERMREACATSLFELIKIKQIGKSISIAQWMNLAWVLLDASRECRRHVFHALSVVIQTNVVHPRFLALPCLLASDDDNRAAAQQAFEFCIRRLRLSHDSLSNKAMRLADIGGQEEEAERLRRIAEDNMPECILPYALYLLSHHPDFPSSVHLDGDGDQRRASELTNSIRMIITALLNSAGTEASNNLSYLIKQVEILSAYFCSRTDESSEGLYLVARIARKLLMEKAKAVENLQPYPGEIYLPMDLYARKSPNAGTPNVLADIDLPGSGKKGAAIRRSPTEKGDISKLSVRELEEGSGKARKATAAKSKAPAKAKKAVIEKPQVEGARKSARSQGKSSSVNYEEGSSEEEDEDEEVQAVASRPKQNLATLRLSHGEIKLGAAKEGRGQKRTLSSASDTEATEREARGTVSSEDEEEGMPRRASKRGKVSEDSEYSPSQKKAKTTTKAPASKAKQAAKPTADDRSSRRTGRDDSKPRNSIDKYFTGRKSK